MKNQELVGQKLLLAFQGKEINTEMQSALEEYRPAGITFFRSYNVDNPRQVKALTSSLQEFAKTIGLPPLLIAADQEGGQLMAFGEGATPLPGNMALGAAGSEELAQRAGEVLGRELSAMGVNMNFAPCCDVNINPRNPVIGTRSFGEDPKQVSALAAAMIQGIQSQGVAAVAKHFPGHGDTTADSHHGLPSLPHQMERLQSVELPPFQAAIRSNVQAVMSAHISLPAIDGEDAPPATLSPAILLGLLRKQMNFQGVIVSDAMDMGAIQQGDQLAQQCIKAANAGIDLLLITTNPSDHQCVYTGLVKEFQKDQCFRSNIQNSAARIVNLKGWLTRQAISHNLDVVGCAAHQAVADEIAERSVTLVQNAAHLIPLKLEPGQHVAVVVPQPLDLTPADTSSYIIPKLADAVRLYHPVVDEIIIPFNPNEEDIQNVFKRIADSDLVICGTINAFDSTGQALLVNKLVQNGKPVIVAALRMPYDLTVFPEIQTYLCTYSIQEPSMRALAGVLFGKIPPQGHLPVSIPGLHPTGFSSL